MASIKDIFTPYEIEIMVQCFIVCDDLVGGASDIKEALRLRGVNFDWDDRKSLAKKAKWAFTGNFEMFLDRDI